MRGGNSSSIVSRQSLRITDHPAPCTSVSQLSSDPAELMMNVPGDSARAH
jgi:hypothetical protein